MLTENDWGQIVDGLTCRAEQYELTAKYHDGGSVDGVILEVSDAGEAKEIAGHYREIIGKLEMQLAGAMEQGADDQLGLSILPFDLRHVPASLCGCEMIHVDLLTTKGTKCTKIVG